MGLSWRRATGDSPQGSGSFDVTQPPPAPPAPPAPIQPAGLWRPFAVFGSPITAGAGTLDERDQQALARCGQVLAGYSWRPVRWWGGYSRRRLPVVCTRARHDTGSSGPDGAGEASVPDPQWHRFTDPPPREPARAVGPARGQAAVDVRWQVLPSGVAYAVRAVVGRGGRLERVAPDDASAGTATETAGAGAVRGTRAGRWWRRTRRR